MEFVLRIEGDVNTTVEDILSYAKTIRKEMIILARASLSPQVAKMYRDGLSQPEATGNNEVSFSLEGFLPCAIEEGLDPFDIKIGLLNSTKVKISKSGNRYIVVPLIDVGLPKRIIKARPYGNRIFRVVSDKSPADSWIHPGLQARLFFEQATEEL